MANIEMEHRRSADQEHEQILEILHRIASEQGTIKDNLIARQHLDDKIISLDKSVNGNGKIGIKEEVAGVKSDIAIIKSDLTKMTWAAGIAVAGMIGQAIIRLFGL